jgi:hypothetical protein
MDVIWGKREGKYFLVKDWTGRNSLIRFGKFAFARGQGAVALEAELSPYPPVSASLGGEQTSTVRGACHLGRE